MIEMLEKGESIQQQTRSFDAETGTSFPLRSKEEADDYRYLTDPDLPPFVVTDEFIREVEQTIPELPEALFNKYKSSYGLSDYDASQLADEKETAQYFEQVIQHTDQYKAAANWILGPIRSFLNDHNQNMKDLQLPAQSVARMIQLVEEGVINFSVASSRLFPAMVNQPGKDPGDLLTELNLTQVGDANVVEQWVEAALSRMPDKVAEYKKGKKGLLGLFVGEVKKISKGKADPRLVNELLMEKLNQ
jgi:aspartyl-tRNA(Asn)/glutamyl-tRNA(Gln) amidotransferase subunit B